MALSLASERCDRSRWEWLLLAILLGAALLRLPWLDRHDLMDDEALLSFRGIGYVDTWLGSLKPPMEAFTSRQWWQPLSFHDHPPLAFLTQHLSFALLGITILAARLPFALAGIATVFVAYLLGARLAGRRFGLWTAAVLAVANYHVWISRVAFIEGLLLLLVVLALWLLVRSLDDPRALPWLGLVVGLSLITKYSALVLVPTVLVVLWRLRPSIFRSRAFWWGVALLAAVLAPVVVYNAMLFSTRGHFDATLSSMVGLRHPDLGTDDHPYSRTFRQAAAWLRWLPQGFDLLTLGLAVAGGALVLTRRRSSSAAFDRQAWVLGAYAISTVVFLSLSPGRKQYVALFIPAIALAAAIALEWLSARWRPVGTAIALASVAAVALVSANSQLRLRPAGPPGLTALALRPASYAYRAIDAELDARYNGQPRFLFPFKYAQYNGYQRASYAAALASGEPGQDAGLPLFAIWDERFDYAAARWTFIRRPFYLHQPFILTEEADQFLTQWGPDKLEREGFKQFLLIFPEPKLLAGRDPAPTSTGAIYRAILDAHGEHPTIVRDRFGDPAAAIYQTSTLQFLYRQSDEAAAGR